MPIICRVRIILKRRPHVSTGIDRRMVRSVNIDMYFLMKEKNK